MEQQVAMLLQQVMEVSDRLRLSEESSDQVRQVLEAHRTVWQMLEERTNRTEASVRDTSQAGGSTAARAQEAPGADDGRFGFGEFAASYQPENFNSEYKTREQSQKVDREDREPQTQRITHSGFELDAEDQHVQQRIEGLDRRLEQHRDLRTMRKFFQTAMW